ncbi:hypothetical protein DPV78_004506 [Talaromyces pinophilus]|nr:hypothetical protein DPV78_004506 [Talaromyces pinophilus]
MSDLPTATTPFTIQGLRGVCEVTSDVSKAHNNGPNTSMKTTTPVPFLKTPPTLSTYPSSTKHKTTTNPCTDPSISPTKTNRVIPTK